MKILAIDPGSERSGAVVFEMDRAKIKLIEVWKNILNCDLYERLRAKQYEGCALVIETPRFIRGATMYFQICETLEWIGAFKAGFGIFQSIAQPTPQQIKGHFGCKSAKDFKLVLQERFGVKGTKKKPGPLFGVASHAWDALAAGVYFADTQTFRREP